MMIELSIAEASELVRRKAISPVDLTKDAGAVPIGKQNMQEFAWGGTSASSFYDPVRNPWDVERIAGGSSGGSAAAVASGMCFATKSVFCRQKNKRLHRRTAGLVTF